MPQANPLAVSLTSTLAQRIAPLLRDELAPLAPRIDRDGVYPEAVLRKLGAAGVYAAANPPPDDQDIWPAIDAIAEVSRTCLSTGFLVWSQAACVWYLANSANPALRADLLPALSRGERLGGTGLSNAMKGYARLETLRLRGERVDGGYVVSGALPWVSNLGPGHLFAALFAVPSATGAATGADATVIALLECGADGVDTDQRSTFCALEGTRTLTVRLKRAFVPDSHVLATPAEPYLVNMVPGFTMLQTGMGLGLLRGAIDVMRAANTHHGALNAHLPDGVGVFEDALETLTATLRPLTRTPNASSPDVMRPLLQTRLASAEWALRAAAAALMHAGANGYLADAQAQRQLREAGFLAIVTPSVKHLRKELAEIAAGGGCMRFWKSRAAELAEAV